MTPQQRKVLTMLEAHPEGVTNGQFAASKVLRYSARVEELRKDFGLQIACERLSGGTYLYRLESHPQGTQESGSGSPADSSLAAEAPPAQLLAVVGDYTGPEPRWYSEPLVGWGR